MLLITIRKDGTRQVTLLPTPPIIGRLPPQSLPLPTGLMAALQRKPK